MIHRGQSVTNHATGETLVFRTTAAETNGESVIVDLSRKTRVFERGGGLMPPLSVDL